MEVMVDTLIKEILLTEAADSALSDEDKETLFRRIFGGEEENQK